VPPQRRVAAVQVFKDEFCVAESAETTGGVEWRGNLRREIKPKQSPFISFLL
jgi:hypothetical protein